MSQSRYNFPEPEFRFSRGDRRCSCSSSMRRYSCSNTQHLHSHSHCCSSDPTRGPWDSLPFRFALYFLRFSLRFPFFVIPKMGKVDDFYNRPRFPLLKQLFFVLDFSEEAEATAEVRVRVRCVAIRARKRNTCIRTRIAVRATQHAGPTILCRLVGSIA